VRVFLRVLMVIITSQWKGDPKLQIKLH